jgi:YqxM protein
MRKSRLRKFRKKNKGKITILKIVLSLYLALISFNNVTSNTNALYKSNVENKSTFKASWEAPPPTEVWDKSSLTFWKDEIAEKYGSENEKKNTRESYKNHYGFSCTEGIYSDIVNDGNTMKGKSLFFVRYTPSGAINKNKPGEIIYEGEIPALKSKEIFRLKYLPDNLAELKPGVYKISALQRPLHLGGEQNESKEYEGRFEIWGEVTITITDEKLASCKKNDVPSPKSISTSSKDKPVSNTEPPKTTKETSKNKKQSNVPASKSDQKPTINTDSKTITAPDTNQSNQDTESKEGEDTQ